MLLSAYSIFVILCSCSSQSSSNFSSYFISSTVNLIWVRIKESLSSRQQSLMYAFIAKFYAYFFVTFMQQLGSRVKLNMQYSLINFATLLSPSTLASQYSCPCCFLPKSQNLFYVFMYLNTSYLGSLDSSLKATPQAGMVLEDSLLHAFLILLSLLFLKTCFLSSLLLSDLIWHRTHKNLWQ